MKHKSRCTKQRKHPKTRLRLPDRIFKDGSVAQLDQCHGQLG
jgi:hypothetical protein